MRRSEALSIILKELNKNFEKSKTICPTSLDFAGIAHDILYRLETIGITPPTYKKYDLNDWYGLSGNNPQIDHGFENVNEWEPEK